MASSFNAMFLCLKLKGTCPLEAGDSADFKSICLGDSKEIPSTTRPECP